MVMSVADKDVPRGSRALDGTVLPTTSIAFFPLYSPNVDALLLAAVVANLDSNTIDKFDASASMRGHMPFRRRLKLGGAGRSDMAVNHDAMMA
jgi:hypothetical protein